MLIYKFVSNHDCAAGKYLLRKANIRKSEWLHYLLEQIQVFCEQIYVFNHVTMGNICSMYSYFGISLVYCIWLSSAAPL